MKPGTQEIDVIAVADVVEAVDAGFRPNRKGARIAVPRERSAEDPGVVADDMIDPAHVIVHRVVRTLIREEVVGPRAGLGDVACRIKRR